jgi:thioester reductase-like protein
VRYHILDEELRPTAYGEPGELFIGGDCLARGYLNLPELTARKFLVHGGERLYRTGDRVVRRADGEYVFLGRVDRQVKVRGLLIEPEEIEARLQEHPAVGQAAVVKRRLTAWGPEREGLVGFLVPRSDASPPSVGELRAFLARSLSRWMLPQRFEVVPELPRTASGKVDLAALAETPLRRTTAPLPPASAPEEAAVLAEVWAEVLGLESVSWAEGFFEQGGDSLTLLEAVVAAHARGLTLPPTLLAEGRPLVELAEWLRARGDAPPGAMACAELRREAESTALPRAESPPIAAHPTAILLTGATGFLGSWLLRELLRRTEAEVFCLIRADHPPAALRRLLAALHLDDAPCEDGWPQRLRAVPGDLARPLFGLPRDDWDRLAERVDAVYHCGAWVNLVLPYASLRPANVLGTREVLRFVASGRGKRLHYASTLSVFVAGDRNRGLLREDDALTETRWVYGGYAQSKWAAEWLLRVAGGPTAYYRLGLITGDSRTGRAAANDFLTLFLRGLSRLGCVPRTEGVDLSLDVTPVDFAAAALAHLSLEPAAAIDGATFHLANPRSLALGELVDAVRAFGVPLEEVSAERWQERLGELQGRDPDAAAACLALCRLLPGGAESFNRCRTMDLFQATGVTFGMDAALAGLAGSGLACPPPGPELLHKYVAHALAK